MGFEDWQKVCEIWMLALSSLCEVGGAACPCLRPARSALACGCFWGPSPLKPSLHQGTKGTNQENSISRESGGLGLRTPRVYTCSDFGSTSG